MASPSGKAEACKASIPGSIPGATFLLYCDQKKNELLKSLFFLVITMPHLNNWSSYEKVLLGIDNVLFYLRDFYGLHQKSTDVSTKNSFLFLNKIHFADPIENLGASFAKELARHILDDHQDGIITGILLLYTLLKGCLELLIQGKPLEQLIESLKQISQKLLIAMDQLSWPIKDFAKIRALLFTSTQNARVAQEISHCFELIGRYGSFALRIEEAPSSVYITQGFKINVRNQLPHCLRDQEPNTILNPKILVIDQYIHSLFPLLPCLQQTMIHQDSLVIFCRDIAPDALASLSLNKFHQLLDVTVISLHSILQTEPAIFEDLALIAGTKIFKEDTLPKPQYEELGGSESIEISKLGTTLVQGYGSSEVLALKIRQLKENLRLTENETQKNYYIDRIQRLQSSVAILSVSKECYPTYLLALTTLQEALHHGYVIGGGTTLFYAIHRVPFDHTQYHDVYHILKQTCLAPITQLIHNVNIDTQIAIQKLQSLGNPIFGVNIHSQQIEDFFVSGILEPTSKIKGIFMKTLFSTIDILTSSKLIKMR